jgi:A/G-specific adenine glycosylase
MSSLSKALIDWYDKSRRDLPWRRPDGKPDAPLDPFKVLVSEFMLQQTQVSTVIPYFHAFMKRFPTLESLASASEQEVLRLWQGLGYYSRARNLQRAAQRIVLSFCGKIPQNVEELQSLPGVGRYTAGAIASIAFEARAPVLDGNVARVLCRIDLIRGDPRLRKTQQQLWNRAEEILPDKRVGDFNSALMELGATVCVPRNPKCLVCPIREFCKAARAGVADRIPAARKAKATPLVRRWAVCVRNRSRWLIEQRPIPGRWAGMWQFVTIPGNGKAPTARGVSREISCSIVDLKSLGTIRHALTHRRYVFDVFTARMNGRHEQSDRRWVTLDELSEYPLPGPHVRIAELLREFGAEAQA